jgi:hypothetical protein
MATLTQSGGNSGSQGALGTLRGWGRFKGLAAGLAVLFFAAVSLSQAPTPAELRARSQKSMNDGNFKVAYDGFRSLCLDAKTEPKQVSQDLRNAVQCLQRLGRVKEFDELVESSIAAHAGNWRLLATAADLYLEAQHQGFLIAGKFERGPHRGGGKAMNSVERDRARALQLATQAMPLALKDDQKGEVSQFYLSLAEMLLNRRGYHEAWRFQALTNLAELPDYDEGYYGYRSYNGAPVDAEGKPVFHTTPKSWEAATSDGQRWRWALEQAVENSPALLNQVRFQFAQFLETQFGVQTMAQHGYGRGFGGRTVEEEGKKNDSGTYALHTLSEEETIAKLASGVKRFSLADEFNFLKIYRQIVESDKGTWSEQSFQQLAQNSENRRQYPAAAKLWREFIAKHGAGLNGWRNERLNQIVANWGAFESTTSLPAGQGATVEFRYRNAKNVKFDARKINEALLLDDVKAYLKSDPGNRIDWQKINIANIGWRLVNNNETKYLAEPVAAWELPLEPRDNHFDRRMTVATPLQKAGAYLVTATVEGGNVSKIVLWVADTAIVHKTLEGKQLYYVADAVTGLPVPECNLEFFGWQQRHLGGNRYQVTTANFAEKTSPDGLVTPDPRDLKNDFQWLVTARTTAGSRLAYLGFQGVWNAALHDPEYNQVKIFTITDRPVYRPNQKVHFKLWLQRAQYDQEDKSQFANFSVPLAIFNPKGEKVLTKNYSTDAYGGLEGELDLPEGATLGVYRIQLDEGHQVPFNAMSGNSFRVEEYKKPEYEVSIQAPTEPVMLGEKITAKITAKYYFGSPVTKATVKYKITRTDHSDNWYPIAAWDWCYGPGYWWFGYDSPWYRGWNEWAGCKRPMPIWWHGGNGQPPELVAEVEREIGPEGTVDVEIDTLLAKELHGDTDHQYSITAEVRDESRRTIVGAGNVLVARKPFKVFTWVDRGYYRVGDAIETHFEAHTLDRKPVVGKGELQLYQITYDDQRQPIETSVGKWELNTGEEGRAQKQLKAAQKGQYRLSYQLTDSKGHQIEGGYLFTIIGDGFDGGEFRFNNLELIPDRPDFQPGQTVNLQVNTDRANGAVLLFIRPTNGVYLPPKLIRLKGKSAVEEIAVVKRDMPNFFVEAVTVAGGKVYSETKELIVPPEKRVLNVEVLPSATAYKPGQKGRVKVRLTDHSGENFVGSTVISMYDKSVEYISGGSNVGNIKEFFWKWRRHHNPQHQDSLAKSSYNMGLPNKPTMQFLGVFGASVAEEMESDKSGGLQLGGGFGGGRPGMMFAKSARGMEAGGAPPAPMAAMAMDALAEGGEKEQLQSSLRDGGSDRRAANAAAAPGGAGGGAPLVEPTVRTKFADTAFWAGAIETGKDGVAEVDITMPENLTGWKIRVWGMGHGARVGSGDAEVVTRKDLIIRLQAPRFFVERDEVVLSANVHNYLPNEKDVLVELDVPGGVLRPLGASSAKVKIPAGGEQRVDWRCKVEREGEAVVRMKALTDEESDAMEVRLPSFVHGMLKTESWAGTVRPDKASGKVNVLSSRAAAD